MTFASITDLNNAPLGTVVVDRHGDTWTKTRIDGWNTYNVVYRKATEIEQHWGPLRIVHTPSVGLLEGVELFMRAAEQPIADVPQIPDAATIATRLRMLHEEYSELLESFGIGVVDMEADIDEDDYLVKLIDNTIRHNAVDLVESLDAFLDIIVVAQGGALEVAGPNATIEAAAEVTRSNLAKIVDGKVIRRADGKILKPEGWVAPDIARVIRRHRPCAA